MSVINETLAQRHFRGQNPIGRRWGNSSNFASDGLEIVGVVTDARYNDVKAGSIAMSYMAALQSQRYLRSIEVRSSGNPAALAGVVRRTLRETEPHLAVGAIETPAVRIVRSIRIERLLGWLTMTFGRAALSLACLRLFGTISNAVKRRTAELGIRAALGADRRASNGSSCAKHSCWSCWEERSACHSPSSPPARSAVCSMALRHPIPSRTRRPLAADTNDRI